MSRYSGHIAVPTLTNTVKLEVKVLDKERYIHKRHLERLFDVLLISKIDYQDEMKKFTSAFSDGWVKYNAFSEVFMKEYLKFENQQVKAVAKGVFAVGIIPLIDETTGYQNLRPDGELSEIFNEKWRRDND